MPRSVGRPRRTEKKDREVQPRRQSRGRTPGHLDAMQKRSIRLLATTGAVTSIRSVTPRSGNASPRRTDKAKPCSCTRSVARSHRALCAPPRAVSLGNKSRKTTARWAGSGKPRGLTVPAPPYGGLALIGDPQLTGSNRTTPLEPVGCDVRFVLLAVKTTVQYPTRCPAPARNGSTLRRRFARRRWRRWSGPFPG
jgi:hypothetical protein